MRSVHHSELDQAWVARSRERSVSVCLPARDEAATIGPILADLMPLIGSGVVDEVVVVDDSTDATAEIARAHGAQVYDQSALCAEHGCVLGKGDAMWRALSVLRGEVIVYLDADSGEFGPHYATALTGLVACGGPTAFAKAFYRRPFRSSGQTQPTGGGRVTELVARPFLKAFFPDLAHVRQPLAGEIAVRRDLLERMSFPTGYGVDVALLIDAWCALGLDGLAQVDLDVRQNRHRPLEELGAMSEAVLAAMLQRARREGRLDQPLAGCDGNERPPLASLANHT